MNRDRVMEAFARHERIGLTIPGLEKYQSNHIVKFAADDGNDNHISWFNLHPENIALQIQAEIDFYQERGQGFEWKVYGTDQPADIGEHLLNHGLLKGDTESFMVLSLNDISQKLPESDLCIELVHADDIRWVIKSMELVWCCDLSEYASAIIHQKQAAPELMSMYAIIENGLPVSSARIVYVDGSPFAGIWGGSTLQPYRRQGFYRALLNKRINQAKARGKQYLYIDASEMSRPIVERYGFQCLTQVTAYDYVPGQIDSKTP